MFKELGKWWRKRQRKIDMEVVWPKCIAHAGGNIGHIWDALYTARFAFSCYVVRSKAWTKDFSRVEIEDFVGRLRPGDRSAP